MNRLAFFFTEYDKVKTGNINFQFDHPDITNSTLHILGMKFPLVTVSQIEFHFLTSTFRNVIAFYTKQDQSPEISTTISALLLIILTEI